MRIGGKKIDSAPASDFIVFPRKNGNIAIRANAVMDREEFDTLVPAPKPPKKRIKGNLLVDDPDSPKYIIALNQHGGKFMDWLVITSLCGIDSKTKDDAPIEWEEVHRQDPSTWNKWDSELKNNGFSDMERKRIYNLVMQVNSLNDSRLDEARNSFLLPPAEEAEDSSSPSSDQSDTQSGEPVNGSEFDLLASQKPGTISQK